MSEPDALVSQVQDLESRLAWQDETIDQLNAIVRGPWDLIDRLEQRLIALEDRLQELEAADGGPPLTPPPHY